MNVKPLLKGTEYEDKTEQVQAVFDTHGIKRLDEVRGRVGTYIAGEYTHKVVGVMQQNALTKKAKVESTEETTNG